MYAHICSYVQTEMMIICLASCMAINIYYRPSPVIDWTGAESQMETCGSSLTMSYSWMDYYLTSSYWTRGDCQVGRGSIPFITSSGRGREVGEDSRYKGGVGALVVICRVVSDGAC